MLLLTPLINPENKASKSYNMYKRITHDMMRTKMFDPKLVKISGRLLAARKFIMTFS